MISKVKCSFEIGEHVLAQNFRRTPKWLPGIIVGKAGNVLYQVKIGHQVGAYMSINFSEVKQIQRF